MGEKILTTPAALSTALGARRARKERLVFTNGCFDLLHIGHTRYLQEARTLGDCLIVGINSDASVQRLKGDGRPVQSESARAAVLASLAAMPLDATMTAMAAALLVFQRRSAATTAPAVTPISKTTRLTAPPAKPLL